MFDALIFAAWFGLGGAAVIVAKRAGRWLAKRRSPDPLDDPRNWH